VKIFLDECVDWRLSRAIVGHDVKTARQMGWTSIKGELLALASESFDVFVMVDRICHSNKIFRGRRLR
jgi:hypothetical protein